MEELRKWRFRFSLWRMLLVLSVTVLAFSHAVTSFRLYRAENDLAELRQRTGELIVDDPELLQVVRIPEFDGDLLGDLLGGRRQWRVRVPPGHEYQLAVELRELAQSSPEGSEQRTYLMESGGLIFGNASEPMRNTLTEGTWIASFQHSTLEDFTMTVGASHFGSSFETTQTVSRQKLPWLSPVNIPHVKTTAEAETMAFDPNEPIELMLWSSQQSSENSHQNSEIMPNLVFKLVPVPRRRQEPP